LPSNPLAGLRVLLLEDEYLIAMDVELLCRDHGAADVIVKRSVEELEGPLGEFDVAIVDLMLGGHSTVPFAGRLRDTGKAFVFASGYAGNDELKDAFPGIPVVGKPYAGTDLIEAVAAAAGRS
jgi:DNA-binding response OmpR family regulator